MKDNIQNITFEEFFYNHCTIDGRKPERRIRDVNWLRFMQYIKDNDIKVGVNVMGEYRKFLSEHNKD